MEILSHRYKVPDEIDDIVQFFEGEGWFAVLKS